jgi:hypothetical protein
MLAQVTKKKTLIILLVIVTVGFAARFVLWINPGYGFQRLSTYDTGTYTGFGIAYVEALRTMNMTALSGINPGVPPLSMILTGLSINLLGSVLGTIQAGLLVPITASTLTAIPAYMISRKYSELSALLAALLISLDPYLIQYSSTYLDAVGTLFIVTLVAFILYSNDRLSFPLAVLSACLAVLAKLTFLIFLLIFVTLLALQKKIKYRRALYLLIIPALALLVSPWMWSTGTFEVAVKGNMQFNDLPFAALLGPFIINVPQSLSWYVLSYLGMGQVFWNTLPMVSPLVLLLGVIYRSFRRDLSFPSLPSIAASSMILTIFLIPRNYWTYSWSGGAVLGVLTRQFYPYYFYPVGPFLAMLAAQIAFGPNSDEPRPTRLAFHPIVATAALAPLAVVMNLGFPYWDFTFTLIYNYSQGQWIPEGAAMIIFTAALTAAIVILAEYLYRRDTNAHPQPQLSTNKGRPNKLLITKLPLFKNHL